MIGKVVKELEHSAFYELECDDCGKVMGVALLYKGLGEDNCAGWDFICKRCMKGV